MTKMQSSITTPFSLKQLWIEYLNLLEKYLPDGVVRVLKNKKIIIVLLVVTIGQIILYLGIFCLFKIFGSSHPLP